MKTNYAMGDIKYYRKLHLIRMKVMGENPVSYPAFYVRLRKMDLKTAIYTPRCEQNVRRRKETPIQDGIRRRATLKENNVTPVITNRYNMKPHKRGLVKRFISLFQ